MLVTFLIFVEEKNFLTLLGLVLWCQEQEMIKLVVSRRTLQSDLLRYRIWYIEVVVTFVLGLLTTNLSLFSRPITNYCYL